MPYFDQLQRASFEGIEFPIKTAAIKGNFRFHAHEYLRVPGAVIEKLARANYTIEMEASFDANIKGYGDLYPNGLAVLRGKYEQGITASLTIPTLGTIPAFMPSWDQTADWTKVRSGEKVKLVFMEDQSEKFSTLAALAVSQSNLTDSVSTLAAVRAQFVLTPADTSLFDKIQSAANSLLAIKDRMDLYGGLLSAKVYQLTAILEATDRAAESLQHPENWLLFQAFTDLWSAAVELARNLAESPTGPRTYIVPRTMSVSDISVAIYGTTEKAPEIMLNNQLYDPFAVPAGTPIIYFVE